MLLFCLSCFKTESISVAQAGVQWHSYSSSNPPASASQVARTTGAPLHARLIFIFFVEVRFCHVSQAGLKLLSSSDPPALTSQSTGITGMSERAWLVLGISCEWPLGGFQLGLEEEGAGETQAEPETMARRGPAL